MKTIAQQLKVNEFPFIILDKNGNEIYLETSDGYWVKKKYDSNGNRVYYEDSSGYWYKIQCDSNGNEIHYENSKGYWRRSEYDCQGNQIHFESSLGFWWKREYDSKGNVIYFENSDGEVIDKRPPECTMKQSFDKIGNFKLTCIDCDRLYKDFGLDVVLSNDQWKLIHPDEKGVICAQCIINRASKIKDVVTVNLTLEFK